jgi:hypothetical protein
VASDQALVVARVAERFGTRPSVLLRVDEPWAAYCVDEALALVAANADSESDPEHAAASQRLGPPSKADLARIPWAGEGPDPLAQEQGE